MLFKYFRNGLIFGFLLEAMITQTRIYDNIIRSSTMKRLEAKRAEDVLARKRHENA